MTDLRRERLLLLTLATVQFTNIMDFMIMMPLGPQLMRLFEIGPSQFSLIVSAYTLSAGASGFLSSFFVDRLDRKSALLWAYLGFTIGTFACAFAPSYPFLVAARLFTGAFGGVLGGLSFSIVGDTVPIERRSHAMGIVMTAFSVASVFGVPFGLHLANRFGWHAPFVLLGGLGLAVSLLIHKAIPPVRGHLAHRDTGEPRLALLSTILASPNQHRALAVTMLLMLGQFAIVPFLSPSMVANVGFSESDLAYIYLLGGLATIFTSPLVGKLADRAGNIRVFTIAAVLCTIPVLFVTQLRPVPMGWALAVTTAFFIASNARFVPAMALVTNSVDPRRRGGFMSINTTLQNLAAGVASYASGLVVTRAADGRLLHYDWIGYWAIAVGLICIPIARSVRPFSTEAQGL